jgi:hypothetical protein
MYLEGFAQWLTQQAVVVYDPTGTSGNCFLDTLPDQPDLALLLRQTGGWPSEAPQEPWDRPTFQVLARGGADPAEAHALLLNAYDWLENYKGILPDGSRIALCRAVQSAGVSLGPDANYRCRFVQNYRVELYRVTQFRPSY